MKQIVISCDVIFDESSTYYPPKIGAPPASTVTTTQPLPLSYVAFLDDEPDQGGIDAIAALVPIPPAPVPAPEEPQPRPITPPPRPVPPPDAPRRGTCQQFLPHEFWRAGAPLVPYPSRDSTPDSPSPSPTPVPLPTITESDGEDSESSEDPLAMYSAVQQSLLAYAGIADDTVDLTLEEAVEYVYMAATSDAPSYHEVMRGPDRDKMAPGEW
ncbi:hypothetical protein FRC15_008742 [Serendipita sp. 397]|nr:hypothetical protein FRC15_008742 [Serendipita sp. 397]